MAGFPGSIVKPDRFLLLRQHRSTGKTPALSPRQEAICLAS